MKKETRDHNSSYHSIIVGDILLHSEIRLTPIQVRTSICNSAIEDRSIPHLISNPSTTAKHSLCDLRNLPVTTTHQRSVSTKSLMHIHKLGSTFMREFKLKFRTMKNTQIQVSKDDSNVKTKQTLFNEIFI